VLIAVVKESIIIIIIIIRNLILERMWIMRGNEGKTDESHKEEKETNNKMKLAKLT
jgi:hypothetical protein